MLHNPIGWMEQNNIQYPNWGMGGVSTVIEHCFQELHGNREFYDQLIRELQAEGLIGQGQYVHTTMTGDGMVESRTTGIGKMFLEFITREK